MSRKLQEQIALELQQLKQLVEMYRPLLERGKRGPVDTIEAASIGAMLHSFYNGVENIFSRIAHELDNGSPTGRFSHIELLDSMARPADRRPAVVSRDLAESLKDYLQFRHVFRSAYTFTLRWEKMVPLAVSLESTLRLIESELQAFIRAMEAAE